MATKYVSALDGGQMDSALMDMATHTSEAWAVGTRNGTPVSGSDVTYHNNAKYYSDKVSTDTQRAEDAAARAEAAVPAGTAGAVFFDRAQSLTTAQQMQAKANISAGGTNPNLLDNPWFGSGEVVNQRGITSATVTGAKRYIDRWLFTYGSNNCSFVIGANGLEMTVGDNFQCIQAFDKPDKLNGKTLTASVMLADGTIYSGTITRANGTQQVFYNANNVYMNMRTINDFFLRVTANMTIRAVKLELGTVSTLANDVAPDYGTELAKCQYYFLRLNYRSYRCISTGIATSTTEIFFDVPVPVTMRDAIPTVSITGTLYAVRNGSTAAITSIAAQNSVRGASLSFKGVTTGLTQMTSVPIYTATNDVTIDVSCDL